MEKGIFHIGMVILCFAAGPFLTAELISAIGIGDPNTNLICMNLLGRLTILLSWVGGLVITAGLLICIYESIHDRLAF